MCCWTDTAQRCCGMPTRSGATCRGCSLATAVLDGRFKGGYITRHYGNPAAGINAVQLELAQRSYMDETSREYLPAAARRIWPSLRALLEIAVE